MHNSSLSLTLLIWLALGLLTALYVLAAHVAQPELRPWQKTRTCYFIIGTGLIAVAFYPPIVAWAHHDIRGHMMQHVLLGMFAPLAWVLASPLTLLLRSLPVRKARFFSRCLRSRFFLWVSHPFTTLMLNIGGMYLLYITPLYLVSLSNIWIHVVVHVHFLLAGYLYCWSIAGRDASPHRASLKIRIIALLLGIAAHGYLAKLMYIYLWPSVPFYSDEAIQAAAKLMYYGGDLAEFLLAIALFSGWQKERKRWWNGPLRNQSVAI